MKLKISDFEFEGTDFELRSLANLFDLSVLLPSQQPIKPGVSLPVTPPSTEEPVIAPELPISSSLKKELPKPKTLKKNGQPRKPYQLKKPRSNSGVWVMTEEKYHRAVAATQLCISKFIPFTLNDVMPDVKNRSRTQGPWIRKWWEFVESKDVEQKKEDKRFVLYPFKYENQVKVLASYKGPSAAQVVAGARWSKGAKQYVDPLEREEERREAAG